jgi:hypothetical protein
MNRLRRSRSTVLFVAALFTTWHHPDFAALTLLCVVGGGAVLAGLGMYARWLDAHNRHPPWLLVASLNCTRFALRPSVAGTAFLIAGMYHIAEGLPRSYTDPSWAVRDPWAGTATHEASGQLPVALAGAGDGPALCRGRWGLIWAAFEGAAGSQWDWDPLLGKAAELRAAGADL